MGKITNVGGVVFKLMCERKINLGLAEEWEKTIYVPEQEVPNFIQKYNMKQHGGLLYIAEFLQRNQRKPKFADIWIEPKPSNIPITLQRRKRRTKVEMQALREAAAKRGDVQEKLKKKRVRRTKAQMEAARAIEKHGKPIIIERRNKE